MQQGGGGWCEVLGSVTSDQHSAGWLGGWVAVGGGQSLGGGHQGRLAARAGTGWRTSGLPAEMKNDRAGAPESPSLGEQELFSYVRNNDSSKKKKNRNRISDRPGKDSSTF